MRPPASLQARALRWLSQREHSTVELRTKLLAAARRQAAAPDCVDATSPPDPAQLRADVDAVIAWLHAHDFLSDERFVESRLHARASVHGVLRIRRELTQHGLALPEADASRLRETEVDRASALRERRFRDTPWDPQQEARQSRFLLRHGFGSEVVVRVLRAWKKHAAS